MTSPAAAPQPHPGPACWLCGHPAAQRAHDNRAGSGLYCRDCNTSLGKIRAEQTEREMRENLYRAAVVMRRRFIALHGDAALPMIGPAPHPLR